MNCAKCKSTEKVKDGKIGDRQRYKCKACGYRYTVELKSTAQPLAVKRQALQLYLEGLGFRSIGRFLKVSHVSVYNWIKSFGKEIEELRSGDEVEIVGVDEVLTYISHKKTTVEFGYLLIVMGKGASTTYLAAEEKQPESDNGKK